MKDYLKVSIEVDENPFREATGLIRFDDDPDGKFYEMVDGNAGALTDRVSAAVREVLARANPEVNWKVNTLPWTTPMTDRGRYERSLTGAPVPGAKRGPKPKKKVR